MNIWKTAGAASIALGFSAIATLSAGGAMAASPQTASATLTDVNDKSVAKLVLTQQTDGVLAKLSVTGLTAGTYGFHIHAIGKCEKPGYTSAGPHWNPTSHQHGKDNPQGPHMGDLLNVTVAASGMGALEQKIAGAQLTGGDHPLLDADGASAMLHAGPDDYKSDPAGNSGARIACGVISPAK